MSEQSLTLEHYLDRVPPERREELQRVWEQIRAHVPDGYEETIGPRFLTFSSEGEWYVALANQKNYLSLYLMPLYVYPEFNAMLEASDKKLKRGKSCINFKRADDLPLDIIGKIVSATPADEYAAQVRHNRANHPPREKPV